MDAEAVKWIGIVGGPDLIGIAQDSEIYSAATAGTRFNLNVRMMLAQLFENGIEVLDVFDVNLLLLLWRDGWPARL